jgi:hypothetical protein
VTGGKSIAVLLQCISGINPLVAFFDTHGRKREVVFFYFVHTRQSIYYYYVITTISNNGVGRYRILITADNDSIQSILLSCHRPNCVCIVPGFCFNIRPSSKTVTFISYTPTVLLLLRLYVFIT